MQALLTGQPQHEVLRGVRRSDGEIRWCLLNAVPLFHPDSNEPYAAVLSFSDITDRKTAEDELRESEDRFRTLAESLPVAVYHTDADGLPVYVNPPFYSISELADDEAWLLSDASEALSVAAGFGPPIDSRRFGPVSVDRLVGSVLFRYAPLRRFGRIAPAPRAPG